MESQKDLNPLLSSMFDHIPGVVVKRKLNSTNLMIRKKVFAFTKGDAIVMNLPQEAIKTLLAKETASLLVMGKRVMKEWVVIQHNDPRDFKKDLRLLKAAMDFVLQGIRKR